MNNCNDISNVLFKIAEKHLEKQITKKEKNILLREMKDEGIFADGCYEDDFLNYIFEKYNSNKRVLDVKVFNKKEEYENSKINDYDVISFCCRNKGNKIDKIFYEQYDIVKEDENVELWGFICVKVGEM